MRLSHYMTAVLAAALWHRLRRPEGVAGVCRRVGRSVFLGLLGGKRRGLAGRLVAGGHGRGCRRHPPGAAGEA